MKKKTNAILCALLCVSLLCACGNEPTDVGNGIAADEASGSETVENGGKTDKKKDKKQEKLLDIADLDFGVASGIVDGKRYPVFSYTNNSEYTVVEFELTLVEKADLSAEQKEAYIANLVGEFGLDESDPDEVAAFEEVKSMAISMHASTEDIISPGESSDPVRCEYYSGYHYVTNPAHAELVEPDIATVRYIDGNTIKKVYYDLKAGSHTKDKEEETAFYWTQNALKDVIPKPDAQYVERYFDDSDTEFSFRVHGWSESDYKDYIAACREAGFTNTVDEWGSSFTASNSDGCTVDLYYYSHGSEMTADFEMAAPDAADDPAGSH